METIYVFNDWTSASKMKNACNPCLSIGVTVLLGDDGERQGYALSVINTKISKTVYRFYIDCGLPNTWSLSTDEAIVALNEIGFNCRFERNNRKISYEAYKILNALYNLGYTTVCRYINPNEIRAFSERRPHDHDQDIALSVIVNDYNYNDFCFLYPDSPEGIEGILRGY